MFERLFRRPLGKRSVSPAVPILLYTDEEFARMHRPEGKYGFSCNQNRQVWPRQTLGSSKEEDRHHLRGQSALLDRIVGLLLEREPLGGVFSITPDGAYFAKDNVCIAVLTRIQHR